MNRLADIESATAADFILRQRRTVTIMCGIVGWIDWRRDLREERSTIAAMIRSMALRGPDAEGSWVSRHAFIGHRRLSIIDLEFGRQPMSTVAADPLILSYAGEVYNFAELRRELEKTGHEFRTRSDTEVVLRSFLEWGRESFIRLRGMYGFAIWDSGRDELWLVRDRFGIKPLYYLPTSSGVIFGSEPKAIFANPTVQPELDATGIAELFALSTAPTPGHGVYKGLYQVKPGEAIRVSRRGAESYNYWSLAATEHRDSLEDSVDHVRRLLEEIVEQQMVSDVPLGGLLSGGLDSSAIAAFAARTAQRRGEKLPTFSVDFPDGQAEFIPSAWQDSWDEPFALEVSRHVGTDHRTILVTPESALMHEDAVLHSRDLPGWGELDTSLYFLFKQVREHTTVALSGESADEVFGGYPFFHNRDALAYSGFPWLLDKSSPWTLFRAEVERAIRPANYVESRYREALEEVPAIEDENEIDKRMREVSYLALTRWLPAMLDRKDRMSMATGLEVRVPFCDHHLVDYVWNLPWRYKNEGGEGKSLLRRAVADLLPQSVLRRRKSGFPSNPNRRYLASLRQRTLELLSTPSAPVFELVDPAKVAELLEQGRPLPSPRASASPTAGMSYLLNLDSWLRQYNVNLSYH